MPQPRVNLSGDEAPQRGVGGDERRDFRVGQVQTALNEVGEHLGRIPKVGLPEVVVRDQPPDYDLDASLRHINLPAPTLGKRTAMPASGQR